MLFLFVYLFLNLTVYLCLIESRKNESDVMGLDVGLIEKVPQVFLWKESKIRFSRKLCFKFIHKL